MVTMYEDEAEFECTGSFDSMREAQQQATRFVMYKSANAPSYACDQLSEHAHLRLEVVWSHKDDPALVAANPACPIT